MSVIDERNTAKALAFQTVRELINPTTRLVNYDGLYSLRATLRCSE